MRTEVQRLEALGRFPTYDMDVPQQLVTDYEERICRITPPVTNDEAAALCRLLNKDDFYGLAWTVVHLAETAPGWPDTFRQIASDVVGEWRDVLAARIAND